MRKFAFYDAREYDKTWFEPCAKKADIEFKYIEERLSPETVRLAAGTDGVVAFVHDELTAVVLEGLFIAGIRLICMRCAGLNNVDMKRASELGLTIKNVPAYSPYAVGEYAAALMFALNRKIHRAYLRTKDFDFSIDNLVGFDLHGKTAGIVGTGRIGRVFADICRGIGMELLAADPVCSIDAEYLPLPELLARADVVSLHCPLTRDSYHLIDGAAIARMRRGALLINTSRGALIETEALLAALSSGAIGGAGLDVYEEETGFFYEDNSDTTVRNDRMTRLLTLPNVIVTSHQAFLTAEALAGIAEATVENLRG